MSVRSTIGAATREGSATNVFVLYVSFSERIVEKTNVISNIHISTVSSLNTNSISPKNYMFYIEKDRWYNRLRQFNFYLFTILFESRRHLKKTLIKKVVSKQNLYQVAALYMIQ